MFLSHIHVLQYSLVFNESPLNRMLSERIYFIYIRVKAT